MHIVINALFLAACWRWGDWRKWKQYQSTMLYVFACDLLYLFMTANHFLWRYATDAYLQNYTIVELLNALIMLPATVLLYVPNFPEGAGKALLFICRLKCENKPNFAYKTRAAAIAALSIGILGRIRCSGPLNSQTA